MNASVKTQLLVRRNAEEQNNALYDLTAWEEKIKQNDSKLSEKRNFAPSYQGNEIGNVEKNCKDNTLFINDESLLIPDNISERNGIVFSTPQQPKQFSDISVPSPPCEEVDESAHIHENEKDINIGLEEDERKQGNEMFGKGDYGGAIKRYTKCISLDPSSVLAYSNRAMAYLKMKDWQRAESDSSMAIKLDALHCKSYQRRSAARLALGKVRASMKDLVLAQEAQKQTAYSVNEPAKMNEYKACLIESKKLKVAKELRKLIENAPTRKVKIQSIKKNPVMKRDEISNDVTDLAVKGSCRNITLQGTKLVENATTKFCSLYDVKTWMEFERRWKTISIEEKPNCLATMKPSRIIQIYKNGIEECQVLLDISMCCSRMQKKGAKYLMAVSKIPSVDMVVMMLSAKEKEMMEKYLSLTLKYYNDDEKSYVKSKLGLYVE